MVLAVPPNRERLGRERVAPNAGDEITMTVDIAAGRCDADWGADFLVSSSERLVGYR